MSSWLFRTISRIRSLFSRAELDRQVEEELAAHIEMLTEENISRGMEPVAARREASLRVGSRDAAVELHREARGWMHLENLARDVRYSVRQLQRMPTFTCVAVVTLALGIGANTAIFSLLNSLMWRMLPVREPAQLVFVEGSQISGFELWEEIRKRPQLFESVLRYAPTQFSLGSGAAGETVEGVWASGSFFTTLGVPAFAGRIFTDADDRAGGSADGPVAVISHSFWQQRFGGQRDAIGRKVLLNRTHEVTIIGVTPPDFFGLDVGRSFDVILPAANLPLLLPQKSLDASAGWFPIVARLKPGQTAKQATEALEGIRGQISAAIERNEDTAEREQQIAFSLSPASAGMSYLRGQVERPLLTMLTVVILVLLIACANIGNLLLARATARQHEMSVRRALGASRSRLVRQLMIESLFLAGLGAAGGLVIGSWGSQLLVRQLSGQQEVTFFSRFSFGGSPLFLDVSIDWRILLFTAGVAFATALLFGVAPALRASAVAPMDALKGQRASMRTSRSGLVSSLVVAQVTLSLMLVVGAGLFLHTFSALANVHFGFEADQVVVADLAVSHSSNLTERRLLYGRVRDAVRGVRGVAEAAVSLTAPPWEGGWIASFKDPRDVPSPSDSTFGKLEFVTANRVTPGWFRAMGIPLIAGRDFEERDRKGTRAAVVVNQAFVRKYLNGANAIGQTLSILINDEVAVEVTSGEKITVDARSVGSGLVPMQIVGIVGDTLGGDSLRDPDLSPTIYQALHQFDYDFLGLMPEPKDQPLRLIVRSAHANPELLTNAVTAAVAEAAPGVTLSFHSLSAQVDSLLVQERVIAWVSGFFGALSLLLAGIGLYGVTAYAVACRRREIGIRIALGAGPENVIRLVLVRAAALVGIGIVLGAGASLWAARFIESLLYGLPPRDPSTFAGAALILAGVGAFAAALPAWRASRIDPAEVLRSE